MGELTIDIRFNSETDDVDIDFEAYLDGDEDGIQSELEYDKQFQDLLVALSERFAEIVDELNKEEL